MCVLAGRDAAAFLARMDGLGTADAQLLIAKLTGNFKRGNVR